MQKFILDKLQKTKTCIHKHKTKEFSSVYRHSSITDHKFNFDSSSILTTDTTETRLKDKESLLILSTPVSK